MWRAGYTGIAAEFRGQQALLQASEQNRLERFFTFPNFAASAERCADQLRAAGLSEVAVEHFPADGVTSWYGWKSMKAWDVTSAQLWMTSPDSTLLCDWCAVPESLVMYSGPCEVRGELVAWDGESDIDLAGKIPFTRHRINDVFPQLRRTGARGIVSDYLGTLDGVREPRDLPDSVRWENSALRSGGGHYWGFMVSPRQGDTLRNLLRQGSVHVSAQIASRTYDGLFHSVTGVIPGSEEPDQEILFVSHLYEPGANDNASGVGIGLELARSLQIAIGQGKLPRPRRSIRFLFNWEGYGLMAWLHKHDQQKEKLLGGLNIDEVGVDQQLGSSVLHLFMPPAANPSCTGYLLAHLCGEILSPGIRWKPVADRAEIINDTISSDPNLDIPLPCLIQYPSRHYHSSTDRLPTLNAHVMERIGQVSGTYLHFLANCEGKAASWLAQIVAGANLAQWQRTRLRLSSGSWPFDQSRTRRWFCEQAALSIASTERFGLSSEESLALQRELQQSVTDWCRQNEAAFPQAAIRDLAPGVRRAADSLVLTRTTPGAPKVWSLASGDPEEDRRYRELLCRHNLDLFFHRILYWADGQRSLLEIVERLEFEWDQLRQDTHISRTSSGLSIAECPSPQLDVEAVLSVVERIAAHGYLAVSEKPAGEKML